MYCSHLDWSSPSCSRWYSLNVWVHWRQRSAGDRVAREGAEEDEVQGDGDEHRHRGEQHALADVVEALHRPLPPLGRSYPTLYTRVQYIFA